MPDQDEYEPLAKQWRPRLDMTVMLTIKHRLVRKLLMEH